MKKPAKEPSRGQASLWTQLLVPLAALVRNDLLGLVHQLGMQAIAAMLEAERTKLCGERYKHDASRRATRAGSTRGELALGGRRVALRRPRVVDRDGHEVPLAGDVPTLCFRAKRAQRTDVMFPRETRATRGADARRAGARAPHDGGAPRAGMATYQRAGNVPRHARAQGDVPAGREAGPRRTHFMFPLAPRPTCPRGGPARLARICFRAAAALGRGGRQQEGRKRAGRLRRSLRAPARAGRATAAVSACSGENATPPLCPRGWPSLRLRRYRAWHAAERSLCNGGPGA